MKGQFSAIDSSSNEAPFEGEVLCAPDSFKGTLSAEQAAEAVARGVRRVWPRAKVRQLPLADGGEGSLNVLHQAVGGSLDRARVEGPLGEPVEAEFLELPDKLFVIEMARASGLLLAPAEKRDAERASTYGTGQLLRAALQAGARKIIVCLGGSATTDGGAGMAEALGYSLLDSQGRQLARGGSALASLDLIDLQAVDPAWDDVEVIAATDVTNPLNGPSGAAAVYGPQKGASPVQVERLQQGLARLAEVMKLQLGADVADLPGAGAAGGLGAGLVGFLHARIESGAEVLMDAAGLDKALAAASLCFTGEGRIDSQTSQGKLLGRLARRCRKAGVPLVAIGGSADQDLTLEQENFAAVLSATPGPGPVPERAEIAAARLEETAVQACRLIHLGSISVSRGSGP